MTSFIRKVKYYETDRMGITHHSNYVRWMEEARVVYLDSIGYGLRRIEEDGITSPVVSIDCKYKHPTTFDDEVKISVWVKKYTGVKLHFAYEMVNNQTNELVFTAESSHCFIDEQGRPIAVKKHYPEFDELLKGLVE